MPLGYYLFCVVCADVGKSLLAEQIGYSRSSEKNRINVWFFMPCDEQPNRL